MPFKSLADIRGVVDRTEEWKITNSVLKRDKEPTVIAIKLTDIKIQQYDKVSEFVKECGGEEQAVKVLNQLKVDAALTVCSQRMRYTKRGPVTDIVKKAIEATRDHQFAPAPAKRRSKADLKLAAQALLKKKNRSAEETEQLLKLIAGEE